MASVNRNMVVKPTPTRGTWFDRFMRGTKKKKVSINRNNFCLSREALHSVLGDLEEYWLRIKLEEQKKYIDDLAVSVIM